MTAGVQNVEEEIHRALGTELLPRTSGVIVKRLKIPMSHHQELSYKSKKELLSDFKDIRIPKGSLLVNAQGHLGRPEL